MPSKTEQVLTALAERLSTVPKARVERNTGDVERIPTGGLIVVRDGDPGEPEQTLGGIGSVYYAHAVEIEVYVEAGEAAARDAAFDTLVREIGEVLEGDLTLGGLAFGMTYGRPAIDTEAVAGAPAMKTSLAKNTRAGNQTSVKKDSTFVKCALETPQRTRRGQMAASEESLIFAKIVDLNPENWTA